jgi:Na+/glutamate symporter
VVVQPSPQARFLVVGGSVLVACGAALPWFRLGGRSRSAFAIARSAALLDLVDTPIRRGALTLLFFTPMLAAMVMVSAALNWQRPTVAIAVLVGVIGVGTGVVGLVVSSAREIGPIMTTLGGVLSLLGAMWILRQRRSIAPGITIGTGRHDE